jgi:hypothetical protein
MRTIVIYPGRFHPFHKGHFASYNFLAKKFGPENVFVVSSDKQAPVTSPFSFGDKQNMMIKLGVPSDRIVKVRNPYQAPEVLEHFDPNTTAVIFAVSEKDAERFSFAPKKDGSPSYMQPYPGDKKRLDPLNKHGYVLLTPTVTFKVRGVDANSASQIRAQYLKGNDNDRAGIIADLYGEPDKNLQQMFDKRLSAGQQVAEMINLARTKGVSESQIQWLNKVVLLEKEIKESNALTEFYPGEFNKFTVYISDGVARYEIDRFSSFDDAIDAVKMYLSAEPLNQLVVWLITDANDTVVWYFDPYEGTKRGKMKNLKLKKPEDDQDYIEEKWSQKYKNSIDCSNPRGFSQRAHCQGRKKK